MAKPLTTTPRATTVLPVRERYSDLRLFETFCPAAADVDKYATIVWYGLGLFGNLIAYRAWTGTSLRKGNSTAVYLAALSMCNLLFFLLHVVHELQFTWDVPTLNYPVVCELYYVGLGTAKSLSPALVLMAVGERWLAVCHPFSKANVLRRGRAKTIVFFLVAAAIGVNSARGYFWKYEYGTVRKCVPRLATYDASGAFTSYWFYGIITEVIAFGVVPLTTIFLAVGIVREMKRSNYRMLKSSFIGGSSPPNFYAPPMHTSCYEDFAAAPYGYYKHPATPYMMEPARPRRRPNKNANTSMLLTVAFYSSLASIPWSIAFGMAVLAPRGVEIMNDSQMEIDANWQSHFTYLSVRKMVEELLLSQYAVVFFLSLTGKRFRQAVLRMFACSCEESPKYALDDGEQLRMSNSVTPPPLLATASSSGGATFSGNGGSDDSAAVFTPANQAPASPSARATYV